MRAAAKIGAIVAVGIVCLVVVGMTGRPTSRPLPVFATVPRFTLVDQLGRQFDSAELKGQVWAANFIFTRCPTVCPTATTKMAALAALEPRLRLVSFTVDPTFDDPERLAAYASRVGASPGRWAFLTGTDAAIRSVVMAGLKIPIADGNGNLASIGHNNQVVLVDRAGVIRGYYGLDVSGVANLVARDAARLYE